MSNDQYIESIYLATKEGRELHRIRHSFTFNIGLEVMKLLKNPFRIFLAPIIFFDVLKKRKIGHTFDYFPKSRFLIIGVDKTGEFHSQEAKKLAVILQNSGINGITLVNNSTEMNVKGHQIQWFRIPATRENNYSRKEWNIIAERLLSSTIAATKPQHIIFFGDYLYRGIINSLEGLPKMISTMWLYSDYPNSGQLNNDKFQQLTKICVPPQRTSIKSNTNTFLNEANDSQSITFIIDIAAKSHFLFEHILQIANTKIIVVQREDILPSLVSRTAKISELIGMPYTKQTFLLIDDSSRLVPELPSIEIPSILLKQQPIESPVLTEMLTDMEMHHDLVIVRRTGIEDIKQSIDYLISRNTNTNLRHSKENYTVEWLKNQS